MKKKGRAVEKRKQVEKGQSLNVRVVTAILTLAKVERLEK